MQRSFRPDLFSFRPAFFVEKSAGMKYVAGTNSCKNFARYLLCGGATGVEFFLRN